jgi:hypothetical protein
VTSDVTTDQAESKERSYPLFSHTTPTLFELPWPAMTMCAVVEGITAERGGNSS